MSRITDDPRIDPRIKALMGAMPDLTMGDVADRAALLDQANDPEALVQAKQMTAMLDLIDDENIAPSAGLDIRTRSSCPSPTATRSRSSSSGRGRTTPLPCVYYIHGGGMASMSCFLGMYRSWGRMIANQGVAVAMVDFRNCVTPSSAPEVEPFPAGLNDCVCGLKWSWPTPASSASTRRTSWWRARAAAGISPWPPACGSSSDGDLGLIRGLYAMCPYIAGSWPQDRFPSSIENNGILLDLHNNRGAVGYGIAAFEAKNPLAWPAFATEDDVAGLVPTVISVNECDPLRDEGIEFYRLLLRAGVPARCRQVMGTIHGTEIFSVACPDISRETAASIAQFCRDT